MRHYHRTQLEIVHKILNDLILVTPTGDLRNKLTDINILVSALLAEDNYGIFGPDSTFR